MFLKENKIIKYKNYNILKEETDRKPKYLYSICGTYNTFYKLIDAKKYIDRIIKETEEGESLALIIGCCASSDQ